jgi:hypothetical protein
VFRPETVRPRPAILALRERDMTTIQTETTDPKPTFRRAREALLTAARAAAGGPVILGPAFGLGALRDGIRFTDAVDQRQWESLLAELVDGGRAGGFGSVREVLDLAWGGDPGVTPISLINLRYQRPSRPLSHALLWAERDDAAIETGPALAQFETQTAFAACAVVAPAWWGFERLPDRHRGLRVCFRLAAELLISDGAPPTDVEIDFDDGEGFRPMAWGAEQTVDYDAEGDRRVVLRATTTEGERTAAFRISVAADKGAADDGGVVARLPDDTLDDGSFAQVYFGRGNSSGKVRRPILLAEGFPGGNPVRMIYDYFNGWTPEGWNPNANLADSLRERGYDVVILIFGKKGAAIQTNAATYLRYLQWARTQCGGPVAALGGSMGGLIARYALAWAEHNQVDISWVSLLMTFDSPHVGANLPMAVQFTARYFRARASDVNTLLDYDCARQMLMHQYWGAASEPIVKKTYTDFYAELEGLAKGGFPTGMKKYAVCNGARNGAQLAPPESHALTVRRGWGLGPHYHAILYTTANRPLPQPLAFANCYISDLGYTTIYSITAPEGFYTRDGCAGGRAPHFAQTRDALNPPCAGPSIQLDHPNSCFIPAYSALGLKRPGDAYGFKPEDVQPGQTPFDEWYATGGNTQHCTIDEGTKNWVLRLFPAQTLSGSADAAEKTPEPAEVLAE